MLLCLGDGDSGAKSAKLLRANPAHHQYVLGTSKWAVLLAMRDDSLGGDFANPRELFEVCSRRSIQVDANEVYFCSRLGLRWVGSVARQGDASST